MKTHWLRQRMLLTEIAEIHIDNRSIAKDRGELLEKLRLSQIAVPNGEHRRSP